MTKMERRESGEKVGDKKCLLFVAVGITLKKRNEKRTNTKRCWKQKTKFEVSVNSGLISF